MSGAKFVAWHIMAWPWWRMDKNGIFALFMSIRLATLQALQALWTHCLCRCNFVALQSFLQAATQISDVESAHSQFNCLQLNSVLIELVGRCWEMEMDSGRVEQLSIHDDKHIEYQQQRPVSYKLQTSYNEATTDSAVCNVHPHKRTTHVSNLMHR